MQNHIYFETKKPGFTKFRAILTRTRACEQLQKFCEHEQASNFWNQGGEETRSGTEKRCSHNLQSGHPAWWSADNYSNFPTVNIFRLFRSKKRTNRGNQKCLKNWKKSYHASLFFLHILFVFRYWNAGETKTQPYLILTNNNALDGFIYRLHRLRFLPGNDNLMPIKTTRASVKFIGSKYTQESFINMSLLLYIS